MWIKVCTMQLTEAVERWVQSQTKCLQQILCPEFCQLLHQHFDRAQHESLLRQLYQIRRSSSVQDYIDHFFALVDQLNAFDTTTSALHFGTHFVMGYIQTLSLLCLFSDHKNWIRPILCPCC